MRKSGAAHPLAIVMATVALGCAGPPTTVRVNAPAGSTMSVGGKRYELPGDSVTFTITLTNAGPVDIERIEVADALPEGREVRGVKGGEGRAEGREARAYFAGPLAIGHAEKVAVTARVR